MITTEELSRCIQTRLGNVKEEKSVCDMTRAQVELINAETKQKQLESDVKAAKEKAELDRRKLDLDEKKLAQEKELAETRNRLEQEMAEARNSLEWEKIKVETKRIEADLQINAEKTAATKFATGVTAVGIGLGFVKWLISFGTSSYLEEHDRLPWRFAPGKKAIDDGLNTK